MDANVENVKRLLEALEKARLHELLEENLAKAEAEASAYADLEPGLVATLRAWLTDPALGGQLTFQAKMPVESDPLLANRLQRLFDEYGVDLRLT